MIQFDHISPDQTCGQLLQNDLHANFTDNQWYCHQARQTVFFAAFANKSFDRDELVEIARNLIGLAPQLMEGFEGGVPGQMPSDEILEKIVHVEEVADMDAYPHAWSMDAPELFDRTDLPLFRIHAAIRQGGPDEQGRAAAVAVLATHALLEGADATNLSRNKNVERSAVASRPDTTHPFRRWSYKLAAAIAAPLQLVLAEFLVPKIADIGFRGVTLERNKLRRVANKLSIPQRSLMFSLVLFAVNDGGKGNLDDKRLSEKAIKTLYTDLNKTSDRQTNDSFFQFSLIGTHFPVHDDFATFARSVDKIMNEAEARDFSGTQLLLNAMFIAHRTLLKVAPFLYSDRTFRYPAGYQMNLSLVPPQRPQGAFGGALVEPITCGTYHPGMNVCVFAPGKEFITFNCTFHAKDLKMVDRIPAILDQLDRAES